MATPTHHPKSRLGEAAPEPASFLWRIGAGARIVRAMVPSVTLEALLRASCLAHGRALAALWRHPLLKAAAILLSMAVLHLGSEAGWGVINVLAGLPLVLTLVLVTSVLIGMLTPAVRRQARLAWAEDERAAFLERNSQLVGSLSPTAKARYAALHDVAIQLGDLLGRRPDEVIAPGEHLLWLYLKLLIAGDQVHEAIKRTPDHALEQERAAIEAELAGGGLAPGVQRARVQTLDLLDQRIATARMRTGRLQEIEADLVRIEHQMALIVDRAVQDSSLSTAGYRVELAAASSLTQADDLPGGPLIAEQDAVFARNLAG